MFNYSIILVVPVQHKAHMEAVISVITRDDHAFGASLSSNGDSVTHCAMHTWTNEADYRKLYNLMYGNLDPDVTELLGLDLEETLLISKSCTLSFRNSDNWDGKPWDHFHNVLTTTGLEPFTPNPEHEE